MKSKANVCTQLQIISLIGKLDKNWNKWCGVSAERVMSTFTSFKLCSRRAKMSEPFIEELDTTDSVLEPGWILRILDG